MTELARGVTALAVVLAACGGTSGNLTIVGSSPSSIGLGQQRMILAEVDPQSSTFLGSPEEDVSVVFVSPQGDSVETSATWIWAIPGVRGFLIAIPEFDETGVWSAAITSPRGTTEPTGFQVNATVPIPEVGDLALPSVTRVYPEFPLEELTTDPEPEPGFYRMTVAEAIGNGTPAVIVFATPAFCQTAVCGPTMDTVKEAVAGRSGFDTVHVEIFENVDSTAGQLVEVDAVVEWGLPSEPWVYVVDSEGIVIARFEGAMSSQELISAIDQALSG